MVVVAVAIVLANVVIAIKAIALVTLGADGIGADARPVAAVNMVRDWGIATVMMLEMHTDTPINWGESIPQVGPTRVDFR
ncbi:hypothetical protein Acid345_3917 [Candidatus Koribacter versatilis Ellin345]|uniref:Uncharacterized protein n=1 Tax=Koribacter versatilis (strain Ellin345) TaxID=204669 RepID=Q1IJN3_KORVE|nr:hypothetical protein Acid345_3917 [Candidatus Koribacter versatilis Ellin345]